MAALGDGLMASPALALLKEHLPRHRLVVLSRAHVVSFFERLPFVDEVVPFASNRWLVRRKPWLAAFALPEIAKLFVRVAQTRWAGSVQWRGQLTDTVLNAVTRAQVRTAAVQRIHRPAIWPVERVPFTGIEKVDAMDPSLHLVEAMAAPAVRLIERLTQRRLPSIDLRMHFPRTSDEEKAAEEILARHQLAWGEFAVLSISSKTPYNQWPVDRFAAVAAHLQDRHGLEILIDALPQDNEKASAIAARLGRPPVWPQNTTLGVAVALIARARVLISYNSAPMHFASVTGTPVVVLGGRDGADIRPWRTPYRVVTGNEFYPRRHPDPRLWPELLGRVRAEQVNAAIDELIAELAVS